MPAELRRNVGRITIMALTLSVWEDSGALIGGHGTIRNEVDNLGYKASSLDETFTFADYPIRRPINDELFTVSYTKYYYFKFQGTYSNVDSIAVHFEGQVDWYSGSPNDRNIRIITKWTNVYTPPSTDLLTGVTYEPEKPALWLPKISTVGPEAATSYIDPVANTTYYTQYLVTQLYVDRGGFYDYGNLDTGLKLKLTLGEPKTGLPGFDTSLINWSP